MTTKRWLWSGLALAAGLLPALASAGEVKNYSNVDQQRLTNPEPGNWMLYRRTYDGQGYSPLDKINASNVKNLVPVWSFSTGVNEGHEAPPIVNNGVMFIATPQNAGDRARRQERRGDLALQAAAARGSVPAPPDQPRRRSVAGQGLPRQHRRPSDRARRQERQGAVGPEGAGLQEGPVPHADAAGGERQGAGRRLRRRVRHPRLCRGLRRQ